MRIDPEVYGKHVKTYPQSSTIFEEGDHGSELYVIIDGAVEIRKKTSSTTSKTLIVLQKGDIFGEMALIEKKPRSATAVVTQRSKLLIMNEPLLNSMIERNPDFAKKMIRILSERIRKANALIQNMTVTNRQNQIMNGLYEFAQDHGISTFKGTRINIDHFILWAQSRLGIEGKDLQMTINTMLKRGQVRQSVTGKEEILIEIKTKAGSRPDGA